MVKFKSQVRFLIYCMLGITGALYFLSGRYALTKRELRCIKEQETTISRPIIDEHELTMIRRRRTVEESCLADKVRRNNTDIRSHVLINKQINMAMCFVPKTGCTFWKRLLYTLQEMAKGQSVGELFNIGKNEIHSKYINTLHDFRKAQDIFRFWQNATTIVFARDPYSRLYSAYVDKLFLPDFWGVGWKIKLLYRNNTVKMRCGHDVTFEEFLHYVIHADETGQYIASSIDDHWQPVARLCHPCDMHYDIIAKQETFSKDRDYLVSKLGISSILPKSEAISRDETNKDAMNQTIDSYWRVVMRETPCVTQLELAERFWRSFQIQGYLPSSLSFPSHMLPSDAESIKEPFRKLAMEMYEIHKPSSDSWKKQRMNEMSKAYKEISTEMMEKIQKHFRQDFEMFSYEKRPEMLYSYR